MKPVVVRNLKSDGCIVTCRPSPPERDPMSAMTQEQMLFCGVHPFLAFARNANDNQNAGNLPIRRTELIEILEVYVKRECFFLPASLRP